MAMLLKSVLFLGALGTTSALTAGDCAFVGIYGDQDDFALVLMEDADGEQLYLTEEMPEDNQLKADKVHLAKQHVGDAKRGAVLKKADFEVDASSLVAPTSLTVFSGSMDAPEPLCSINMDAKSGSARALSEEVSVVNLGITETAQYAGSTSGSKEDLLEDITNPSNWMRQAARKLEGFSIAKGNTTGTMSTQPPKMHNGTMTMTTTITMTGGALVVSGCTALDGPLDTLQGSTAAASAFSTAVGSVAGIPSDWVQNVIFVPGTGCARRLSGTSRFLQSTSGSVTYDIVIPTSLGVEGAQQVRDSSLATLSTATTASVTTALKEALVATGDATLITAADSVSVTSVSISLPPALTTMTSTVTTMITTTSVTLEGGTDGGAVHCATVSLGVLLAWTQFV